MYTVSIFYIWGSLQLWVKNAIFAIYDDWLHESSVYFLSDCKWQNYGGKLFDMNIVIPWEKKKMSCLAITYSEEVTDGSCTRKSSLTDTSCMSRRKLTFGVMFCQLDWQTFLYLGHVSGELSHYPVIFTCGSCGDWRCQGGHLLDGSYGLGFSEGSEIFTYSFRNEKWRCWREASRFQ